MDVDKDINVLGKSCPIPLITLAKEVNACSKGQVIRVIGNDPIFEPSVVDFCREGGHKVIDISREGRKATIIFMVGQGQGNE